MHTRYKVGFANQVHHLYLVDCWLFVIHYPQNATINYVCETTQIGMITHQNCFDVLAANSWLLCQTPSTPSTPLPVPMHSALSSCIFWCCCSSSEEDTTGSDGGVGVSIRLNRCPIRAILALLMAGFVAAVASPTMEGMSDGKGWVNRAVLGAAAASEHGFGGGERVKRGEKWQKNPCPRRPPCFCKSYHLN